MPDSALSDDRAIPPEAFARLRSWLPVNSDPARPQISLATISTSGAPDVRTVLLSEFDVDGFYVHTDSRSRKVEQLLSTSAVAFSILWPEIPQQLTVQGVAEVAPSEEQSRAWAARSPYLKQLAWQNSAEFAQLPLAEREDLWAQFALDFPPETLEQPATWTGFLIRPRRLTFWESNPLTASRRTEYGRTQDGWTTSYLPG